MYCYRKNIEIKRCRYQGRWRRYDTLLQWRRRQWLMTGAATASEPQTSQYRQLWHRQPLAPTTLISHHHHRHPSIQCLNIARAFNAAVTCEIKLFQDYFSLRRRPSEIILFRPRGNLSEIIAKLFCRFVAAREHFLTCSLSLKWFSELLQQLK